MKDEQILANRVGPASVPHQTHVRPASFPHQTHVRPTSGPHQAHVICHMGDGSHVTDLIMAGSPNSINHNTYSTISYGTSLVGRKSLKNRLLESISVGRVTG